MSERTCQWCRGAGRKGKVICPKCDGLGIINYHYCFAYDDPDGVSPAVIARMQSDPTYRELIDGPVLEALPDALAALAALEAERGIKRKGQHMKACPKCGFVG